MTTRKSKWRVGGGLDGQLHTVRSHGLRPQVAKEAAATRVVAPAAEQLARALPRRARCCVVRWHRA